MKFFKLFLVAAIFSFTGAITAKTCKGGQVKFGFPAGRWQETCDTWGWRWQDGKLYLAAMCKDRDGNKNYTTFNVSDHRDSSTYCLENNNGQLVLEEQLYRSY